MTDHDPLDIRGQEHASDQRDQRGKLAARREAEDIKWLMSSEQGRRVLWGLLDRAGVFRLSFSTNAMQMAFAEGGRNEGLRMLAMIHAHCADSYPLMLQEQNQ